jgi:hypothetical protein
MVGSSTGSFLTMGVFTTKDRAGVTVDPSLTGAGCTGSGA